MVMSVHFQQSMYWMSDGECFFYLGHLLLGHVTKKNIVIKRYVLSI